MSHETINLFYMNTSELNGWHLEILYPDILPPKGCAQQLSKVNSIEKMIYDITCDKQTMSYSYIYRI